MKEEYLQEAIRDSGYNASRLSRALGVDYIAARAMLIPEIALTPLVRPTEPMPEDITTLGKGRIASYVIAVKAAGDAWPAKFAAAIHKARRQFDEGTHIMTTQTRKDGWVVLYSITRRRPLANPRAYFSRSWCR
jgi:hypothetical protein